MTITELQLEVLNELCPGASDEAAQWLRPLDVGGSNRSHHSRILGQLVKLGFAEETQRAAHMSRGSKRYRATPAGEAARDAIHGPRKTRAVLDKEFAELVARKRAEKLARQAQG